MLSCRCFSGEAVRSYDLADLDELFKGKDLNIILERLKKRRNTLENLEPIKEVDQRRSWTLKEKRAIVLELLTFEQTNPLIGREGAVSLYGKKKDISKQVLNKWKSKPHLQPGYILDKSKETSKRFGKVGRDPEFSNFLLLQLKDYVNERFHLEKQTTSTHIVGFWEKTFGQTLTPVQTSRLLKRSEIVKRAHTSKPNKEMCPEELKTWEDFIVMIRQYPMVVLEAHDEKPMRKLYLGDKTLVPKGSKQISFQNGGRGARATNTLSIGIWVILRFGKMTEWGKAGMGILMKGGKAAFSVPRIWENRNQSNSLFSEAEKKRFGGFYTCMSPKGVMKGLYYEKFLNFHMKRTKKNVFKALEAKGQPLNDEDWKQIPKFSIDDSAPGHSDEAGCEELKKFWLQIKETYGWENKRIPKNSSDRTQPGDLGVNRELQRLYSILSSKFIEADLLTPSGNIKLPGQETLLKWYMEIWKDLKKDVIRSSWHCSAIPKNAGRPRWPPYDKNLKTINECISTSLQ